MIHASAVGPRCMNNFQKMVWTSAFAALYMIAGVRLSRWVTASVYVVPTGSAMHNLLMVLVPPFIALAIAAPGGYLVYRIWKDS